MPGYLLAVFAMHSHPFTSSHPIMALLLLALLATTSLVAGGYTPCSDPTVCGSCCVSVINNGATTTYCCPGTGNWLDYDTMQCNTSPDCSQLRGGDRQQHATAAALHRLSASFTQ